MPFFSQSSCNNKFSTFPLVRGNNEIFFGRVNGGIALYVVLCTSSIGIFYFIVDLNNIAIIKSVENFNLKFNLVSFNMSINVNC